MSSSRTQDPRINALLALVDSIMAQRNLPIVPVPFAMQGDPAREHIIAASNFQLSAFVPGSDGSYDKSRGLFLATGKIGLLISAGIMAGQAARNARRRRAAEAAMTHRWVAGESGALCVSQLGFYLITSSGIHFWGWGALDYVSITAAEEIELLGRAEAGAVRWRLRSEVAELVFFLWAIVRAPHHPQLTGEQWHIAAGRDFHRDLPASD